MSYGVFSLPISVPPQALYPHPYPLWEIFGEFFPLLSPIRNDLKNLKTRFRKRASQDIIISGYYLTRNDTSHPLEPQFLKAISEAFWSNLPPLIESAPFDLKRSQETFIRRWLFNSVAIKRAIWLNPEVRISTLLSGLYTHSTVI